MTNKEKEKLNLKIHHMKELLFEKSFLQCFTEELVKKKYSLLARSHRFNDASDVDGLRYEIKGTVVRDKGKDYRTNKSTFSKEMIAKFIEEQDYNLETGRKICSYDDRETVRFVSIFNKLEFNKFDIFMGVIYFDDVIKIVSYSKRDFEKNTKLSEQFAKGIFSLSLDRNNIKEFIDDGLILSLSYEEIFK